MNTNLIITIKKKEYNIYVPMKSNNILNTP